MGRHLEFDKQDVLGNAMQVFWRKGYAETSMQDLADACGINKASIYNTWTNKEQFFSAVIDFYCDSITRQNAEELRGQDSGRAAIEAYFDGQIAFLCNEGHGLGCFLTNTAGELGFTSPPIIERLRKIFFEMMENFMGAVRRGQEDGSIVRDEDPLMLALTLQNALQGIRMLARAGDPPEHVLRHIMRLSMRCLDTRA
ncbi:MAG TPA: TetR/AcrR family transcriptional regulator [Kaistiaceae bacterium]|nr:TetR/AcrR family transcriptional regulator [Kaistiaceae bacterium]